jgi:hypothetical protein
MRMDWHDGLACAFGVQAAPKVAVTDLAYQARGAVHPHRFGAEQLPRGLLQRQRFVELQRVEATTSYIEQGELRKFTGDIKGEILRTGMFQLVQGTPYTAIVQG